MSENTNRVAIKSTINAQIGINVPDLRLKREWPRKGAVQYIDFADLEQAIYDPGIEYQFKTGMLYIEDMKVKIALGLEPDDAEAPTNVIVLDDKEKKRFLTVAPVHELKEIIKKLSHDQLIDFANYAIELKITDMARCELLKEVTDIDIVKTVFTNAETERLEKAGADKKD